VPAANRIRVWWLQNSIMAAIAREIPIQAPRDKLIPTAATAIARTIKVQLRHRPLGCASTSPKARGIIMPRYPA